MGSGCFAAHHWLPAAAGEGKLTTACNWSSPIAAPNHSNKYHIRQISQCRITEKNTTFGKYQSTESPRQIPHLVNLSLLPEEIRRIKMTCLNFSNRDHFRRFSWNRGNTVDQHHEMSKVPTDSIFNLLLLTIIMIALYIVM